MGLIERWRANRDKKRQANQAAAQRIALSTWEADQKHLAEMLNAARTLKGFTRQQLPDLTMQLKRNELVVYILRGCSLVEPRRAPGHYAGRYSGFSFRVAKGVRYHTGGSRGTYVQGAEAPATIDTGTITITTQRVAFQGSKQAREWAFTKLLGMEHDPRLPLTSIQVSNRQKVSGFLYDQTHAADVHFRLALALALFNDTTADLAADIQRQLAEHEATKPQDPSLP
jgi:hypothetical protein